MTFNDIFLNHERDLNLVEERLREIFSSDTSIIPMIGEHIIRGGGKRLRPLFLLLSADLADYNGEDRVLLAGIIEAIHTASLLHDDVVDSAEMRRGKPAAHLIWGNQIVILVGDFLYANALRLAVFQKNQRIMETLSAATTAMTEGEILQLSRIADPEITPEEYYRIISAKTGALISAACRIGGILGGLPPEKEDALGRFGMKTGIAFQMTDDILDYMAEEKGLGKKLGKDLEEGKITLPMIHLLGVAADKEKSEIKGIIKGGQLKEDDLKRILDLFEKYSAIEESFRTAQRLVMEAKGELELFPRSPQMDALLKMADYALAREK
ncbi:MAG: polyprenyl synthetase family protein [Thermodesulfovibrionales bacterium]